MDEFGFALALRAVTDIRAPRLKALEIAARRYLPIEVLAGKPDFEIIGLGCGKTHIAGAEQHTPIREVEPLQDCFRIASELLVLALGIFRPRELYQLDFLELMLPDDAAYVLTIG